MFSKLGRSYLENQLKYNLRIQETLEEWKQKYEYLKDFAEKYLPQVEKLVNFYEKYVKN